MNNSMTKTEQRPVGEGQHQQTAQVQPSRGYVSPRVNITETKDGYLLQAEMPGVNKDGLDILLEGNELTLVGHRSVNRGDLELVYRESSDRDYRRSFALDPVIDTGKIEARMENGVLNLHLPKAEQVKPKKITVS